MGLLYLFLLLGTIIGGAVGLSGGDIGLVSPPPSPTITITTTPAAQYAPIAITSGPAQKTLQLNAIAFGIVTPTPGIVTPTPPIVPTATPTQAIHATSTPTPTPTPVFTCKALIVGSYNGHNTAGPGTQNQASASLDISYDPANPATSTYDYSWSQPYGGSGICPGAKEFAITGTVTETFNGICTPDPASPNPAYINKGLGFTFTAPWTSPGGSGCVWNANRLNPITFCAVPPTASTSYVLNGTTASIFIPPLGDPISLTTGQADWQWYNTEYHAPTINGQSGTYNPQGSYRFTFQPSNTCPTP